MQLSHVTLRDPDLLHQAVLQKQNRGSSIVISCNCLHKGRTDIDYEPMGITTNLEESRILYNDPSNHRKPFGKEDVAKW